MNDTGSVTEEMIDIYDDPMIDRPGSSDSGSSKANDSDEEANDVDDEEEEEEEEEASGVDVLGMEEHRPYKSGPSKPSHQTPSSKALYRPPTLAEIEKLEAASSTGNTFALQLEALVDSTILPHTPPTSLKGILAALHSTISSISPLPAVSAREAAARLKNVDIPWVGPVAFSPVHGKGREDSKWTLGWEKPSEIIIGGSWGVCGGYKKGKGEAGGVDMVIVMPEVCISPFSAYCKTSHLHLLD